MTTLRRAARAAASIVCAGLASVALLPLAARAQSVVPPSYVVNDVRLVDQPEAPRVSLVLRDGRIAGILDDPRAEVPGARRIDGKGMLALPAFIDAWSHTGAKTPAPEADRDAPPSTESDVHVEMRSANRKGIQPSFRAADGLDFQDGALEAWRKAGFAILHVAPKGELLAGRTAVVAARDAAARDLVLRSAAFQAASFQASGRGYPNTLMGYHAQLRQFMLDAEHHAVLQQRRREGKAAPRPPYDPDLEAGQALVRGAELLACHAEAAADVGRWLRLADELGLRIAIAGGREAHELAGQLAARRIPVLLTLDWGKEVPDPDARKKRAAKPETRAERDEEPGEAPEEPEDPPEEAAAEEGAPAAARPPLKAPSAADEVVWEYTEPLGVRRERRRQWEETRRGAVLLHEAGVRFAFGTGAGKPDELLKRVRTLVAQGLPRAAALDALGRGGAELLGIADRAGRIEVGYDAHVALWTASPLDEKARLAWLLVDGVPHRFDVAEEKADGEPAEGVDATGTWSLAFESELHSEPATLVLEMGDDGAVAGTVRLFSPFADEVVEGPVTGQVTGRTLRLRSRLTISGFDVDTTLSGELEGDAMEGDATWVYSQGELTSRFTAERKPEGGAR